MFRFWDINDTCINIVLSDVLRCKCSFDMKYGKEEYSKGAKYFFQELKTRILIYIYCHKALE